MSIRVKSSFILKAVVAGVLVALGDFLFWSGGGVGSNLGVFAMAWALATLLMQPATWRNPGALIAAAGAVAMGASLIWDPTLLGFAMFWALLACAALLPRYQSFDHVGRWALRLFAHGATSSVAPWIDLFRILRSRRRRSAGSRVSVRRLLPLLPLPLIGGAVFFALFASANPVISDALMQLNLPDLTAINVVRWAFWIVLLVVVWATLRPRRVVVPFSEVAPDRPFSIPGVTIGSVTLALVTFNLLFAMQNGLDLAFLWSGAQLPKGMTLAAYAHRGAYPLIATALLAGLFVLVCLRPGSATAKVPLIRWLVVAWVVQNVFLVASSILRTLDYIEVYSLTRLRISALIWMALVAVGLVLILWRMLRGKSGAWLINANALTAGLVLAGCCVIDLGSVAAAWNVRNAKEVGGKGAQLDLCYLNDLGPSALVSLAELDQRGGSDRDFAQRLAWVRTVVLRRTQANQALGWWTWRNAGRIDRVRAIYSGSTLTAPAPGPFGRNCDGTLRAAPEVTDENAVTIMAEEDNDDTMTGNVDDNSATMSAPTVTPPPTPPLTKEPKR